MRPRFYSLLAASVVLSACSALGLPPPPGALLLSGGSLSAGEWRGTTAQGMPIAFTVAEDETLTELTIGHRFADCMGTETFSNLVVPTAQDVTCFPGPCSGTLQSFRQFGFENGNVSGPHTMVRGLFLPGGRAQGQANFTNFQGCGSAPAVEWTATRR